MTVIRDDAGAHEGGVLNLAQRALGWGDDPRFRALYRWKHDENPFGRSPRWVALDDGHVVGFRVLLRWRFRRGDEVVEAVRAVDTATDPDHQGKGIFRRLTLTAVEQLTDVGVGFVFNTPNDQSRPGYLKMGWIDLGRPPVAMAPRIRSMPTIARSRASAERWSMDCNVGIDAVTALADPERCERLLAHRAFGPLRWRTDHTPGTLLWRYSLEPLRYRVIDDGDSAAIFRLRRRGAGTEATISEIMAPDGRSRRALVRRVLRETGADYALVSSRSSVDRVPSVAVPQFSPRLTWRALAVEEPVSLDGFGLSVGDLELF